MKTDLSRSEPHSGSSSPARIPEGNQDLDRLESLAKPFDFAELLRKVRALLDAAAPLPRRKPWCCD